MIKYALIPAYEPDEKMPALCSALRENGYRIVVVDDGSKPSCAPFFAQAEAQQAVVLHHEGNKGKGAALKTGLTYLSGVAQADDVIVTVDADGQHLLKDVERVVQTAHENPGALVLGSRAFSGKVPLRSRIGNTITRGVYSAVAHCNLTDTQTGLRAFTGDRIPFMLDIQGNRYEYEMNMLLLCPRNNVRMLEVTIETVYIDDNSSSHFHPVRDAFRIYREVFKFSLASFGSFLIDYGMFILFSTVLAGLGNRAVPIANVLARIISAVCNYSMNRKFVFQSTEKPLKSFAKYALLAVCILLGNTLVLTLLTDTLGMSRYIAKLLTEIGFFLLSWQVQKRFVFRK